MKTFEQFINESKKPYLKYYAFDWDDNILHMSTMIHMDKLVNREWMPEDVSTDVYAKIRNDKDNWRMRNDDPRQAYCEFRDWGSRGNKAFLEDVKYAIKNKKFGPSWNSFIDCLTNGNIFMIITTRGHSPENMKNAIEWIIYNVLTDEQQNKMIKSLMQYHELFDENIDYVIEQYLNVCDFVGVMSNYFKEKFGNFGTIENGKEMAMKYFKDKIIKYGKQINYDIKLGFSDDDIKFKDTIMNFMKGEKKLDFLNKKKNNPNVKYFVYDTSDPKHIKRTKI